MLGEKPFRATSEAYQRWTKLTPCCLGATGQYSLGIDKAHLVLVQWASRYGEVVFALEDCRHLTLPHYAGVCQTGDSVRLTQALAVQG